MEFSEWFKYVVLLFMKSYEVTIDFIRKIYNQIYIVYLHSKDIYKRIFMVVFLESEGKK